MQCVCGSQAGEYKSGVSKKNGKPWKGWKCQTCGEMQFLRQNQAQGQQTTAAAAPVAAPVHNKSDEVLQELRRQSQLLAKIYSALEQANGKEYEPEPEELKADETVPF